MNWIERTISQIPAHSTDAVETAIRSRWNCLTKPRGSLGRLEECVVRVGSIQGTANPTVNRQAIYIFCGDHGITEEGVSAYPSIVTQQMVENFVTGGAAINVLCRSLQIHTHIVDAGVAGPKIEGVIDRCIAGGTRNFAREPAMSQTEVTSAIEAGIALSEEAANRYDVAGLGEMGIGNSTAASALLCALTGLPSKDSAGRGAGLDDAGLQRKQEVLRAALDFHKLEGADPMRILGTFGGFEIAMMVGFLLGAAAHRLPVVVDGFISSAAFLAARSLAPDLSRHVLFAHESAEPGHAYLLSYIQAKPLLNLEMRLGEGTGAALALSLLRSAVSLYCEMATFEGAAVSDRS